MLGCLFALWLLFAAVVLFFYLLGVFIEYPELAALAVVIVGCWWLARRVRSGRAG